MTDELLDTVAELPKVMPHIEVPDPGRRRRGAGEHAPRLHRRRLPPAGRAHPRQRIPGVSIATDIIVGFPGETEAQFQHTYDLLAELKLDVAHLARYSARPGTVVRAAHAG